MRTRYVLAIGVLALGGAAGAYWLSSSRNVALTGAEPLPEKADATVTVFAKSLEREIPIARRRAAGRAMTPEQVAELEASFDAVVREKGDRRVLERWRPTTELGKRLSRLAMSVRLAKDLPKGQQQQLVTAYFDGFAQSREQTLAEGRTALSSLSGSDFAFERIGLLAVLGDLPDSSAELTSISLNELTAGAPPARPSPDQAGEDPELKAQAFSWGPAQVLPFYAYKVYLDSVGHNPQQAMSGTLQALQSQQDAAIRVGIAQAYLTVYPGMKAQLYQQLAQTGVQLPPDIQPAPPGPSQITPPRVLSQQ